MANSTLSANRGSGPVLAADLLVCVMSSAAAVLAVRWLTEPFPGFSTTFATYVLASAFCSCLGLVLSGASKVVVKFSTFQSIYRLFAADFIKTAFLSVGFIIHLYNFIGHNVEFLVIAADFFISFISLILIRLIIISIQNRLVGNMEAEVNRTPVMIYGLSDDSIALMKRLENSGRYKVAGFLSRAKIMDGCIINDCRVYAFADDADLEKIKADLGVCAVMFATQEDVELEQTALVKSCVRRGVHVISASSQNEPDLGGISADALREAARQGYVPDGMSDVGRFLKRGTDLVLSAVLIVVFAIPMLICWLVIKLDDGGPALYRQERIGRYGKPFNILKFRSMRLDAEKFGPALFAGEDDPRLTKAGRFLRAHHLDEMPQLFNVFRGDMAFVGYRPERQFYIDQIMEKDPRYYYLYQIRPGVTSYATLKNGYTDTLEKMLRRLEFDLYYLRHRSIAFDIEILWRTFTSIVFGKRF